MHIINIKNFNKFFFKNIKSEKLILNNINIFIYYNARFI